MVASISGREISNTPIVPEPIIPPEAEKRLRGVAGAKVASALLEKAAENLEPGPAREAAEAAAALMRVVAGVQMVTEAPG
jgi:hypothetical protein